MLKMIEIAALPNGAHKNQDYHGNLPEGWALLPTDELENFPFGEVEVDTVDGLPTVVKWTPGEMPEPAPETDPVPTLGDRVTTLEASNAELTEALDLLLSGVTE